MSKSQINLLAKRLDLDLDSSEKEFILRALKGEQLLKIPNSLQDFFENIALDGYRLVPEIYAFLNNDISLLTRYFSGQFDFVESNKNYSLLEKNQSDQLKSIALSKTPLVQLLTDDLYLSLVSVQQSLKEIDFNLVELKPSQDLFETTDWMRLHRAAKLWNLACIFVIENQNLPRSFFNAFKDIPVFVVNSNLSSSLQMGRPCHEFKIKSHNRHTRIWFNELQSRGLELTPAEESQLIGLFPYTLSTIEAVVDEASGSNLNFQNILQIARKRSAQALEVYAKRIQPSYTFDDLILPADKKLRLKEISDFIRSREIVDRKWGFQQKHTRGHGVTILFEGASGTGKTMAAEVLANTLGLDLFQVDLSILSSKYIGETEKNLSKIFQAARQAAGILLFDEGESLFSKRSTDSKSSQDRYANQEVNFLLQELESYEGIVVISTNLAQSIDQAFLRRITFELSFPRPDLESRKNIWNALLKGLPVADDIDINFLSSLPFAGGFIRNIIRQAAAHAAISNSKIRMKDVLQGVKREYQKSDMPIERDDFGEKYWRYVSLDWETADASQKMRQGVAL